MNTRTRFSNLVKKMVLPLAVCGMMCATGALAQDSAGDVIGFYSDYRNTSPNNVPGATIEFTIRVEGTVVVSNLFNTIYVQPQIRMQVGSEGGSSTAYATLKRTSRTGAPYDQLTRTDLTFSYTIRPGDMADPLKIFTDVTSVYPILDNQCWIYLAFSESIKSNVVWKLNNPKWNPVLDAVVEYGDSNLAYQNIRVNTLSFDSANAPTLVARAPSTYWRINSGGTSSVPIKVWVWTPHTNLLQVGLSPNKALEVTIPAGVDYVDFPIKGLNTNAIPTIATVYAQRPSDYVNNATSITNFITSTVQIEPPGEPTIGIEFRNTLAQQTTLSETNALRTGEFRIVLSEADTTNDVYVSFALTHQPSTLTNIVITPQPSYRVRQNEETSVWYPFNVINGTKDSDIDYLVLITPMATNTSKYTISNPGGLNVLNVAPSVQWAYAPTTEDENTVVTFEWENLTDVTEDMARGIEFRWNFGDGTRITQTNFLDLGSISHTYTGIGPVARNYTVSLTIKDADGGSYTMPAHTITINPAPKPPNVSIAVNSPDSTYYEGDTTAKYQVVLSAEALQDTMVTVVAQYVTDGSSANNCLGLSITNITVAAGRSNSAFYGMTIKDGTLDTATGILLVPTITNAAAQAQYPRAYAGFVAILNNPPTVDTQPTSQPIAPSTSPVSPYDSIIINTPFTFRYKATDIAADVTGAPPITVEFQFEDGSSLFSTGATGTVTKTFNAIGRQTVFMVATDKDGGVGTVPFPINVVAPPSITVLVPPGSAFSFEDDSINKTMEIYLSRPPSSVGITNRVVVFLDVTPPNDALNGAITVPAFVEFNPSQTNKTVYFQVQDGTALSVSSGFTVTPRIASGAVGANIYTEINAGEIRVQNKAPVIQLPVNGSTNTIATVGQPCTFNWSVIDVPADNLNMQLVWTWGDGTSSTTNGGSGSITHTYMAANLQTPVSLTATDKDGAITIINFIVIVKDSKKIIALPIRPNTAGFNGLTRLGEGTIIATNASPSVYDTAGLFYTFYFGADDMSAQLLAIPSPTPLSILNALPEDVGKSSYFFAWNGPLVAFQDPTHVTQPLAPRSTIINLPSGTVGTGGAAGTTLNGNIVQVSAIFTIEYNANDVENPVGVNNGDLNQDGVPDRLVQSYFVSGTNATSAGATSATSLSGIWFQNLGGYNADEDYLPVYPTGDNQGVLSFAPVANPSTLPSGIAVNAFTAFKEIRGTDGYLGTPDDRETDPTRNDTDNDGYPDGWEYWFWYESNIHGRVGSRYNPFNIAQGDLIDDSEIVTAFDPRSPRSAYSEPLWRDDFDNDGLLDVEELVLGTDPTNWDTDGDIMADGWEVLNGFEPCDGRDGNLPMQNNPDADYFAISTAPRRHIQVVTTNGGFDVFNDPILIIATNHYFVAFDPLTFTNYPGRVTTAYRYGNDANGPWAVGRPVADAVLTPTNMIASPAATNENPLIMHFQVRNEYLFDPRTAWIGTVPRFGGYGAGPGPRAGWPYDNADRFGPWAAGMAPDTRPFTAVDEYLLLKFMYELQLNGMVATNNTGWIARFNTAINLYTSNNNAIVFNNTRRILIQESWSRFTTHAHTPDTDATTGGWDGVPDGWELYVAVPLGAGGNVNVFTHTPWVGVDASNWEYWGTDSIRPYTNANLYYFGITNQPMAGVVTIIRPVDDPDNYWVNKFWPTDPWSGDTDNDGMGDGAERAFIYGNAVDIGGTCIAGGGLNPCSIDTDRDALPDPWENQFAGTPVDALGATTLPALLPGQPELFVAMVITNGQDGTVTDEYKDADLDGLASYQEYMTQSLRCYRYDIPKGAIPNDATVVDPFTGNIGQPMDITFEVGALFEAVSNEWDQCMLGWPAPASVLWWMRRAGPNGYCSTDPNNPDSDYDSMDDFYEMYHGLNPLLGNGIRPDFLDDRVAYAWIVNGFPLTMYDFNWWMFVQTPVIGFTMDFNLYPWLNGMPTADPDADGLLNLEEMLIVNMPLPENYNTDPTPLWMTDPSNINSLTARFYPPYGYTGYKSLLVPLYRDMWFWPAGLPPFFTYQFEMNEGYDTDNDGVSDKDELVANRNTKSNPLDSEDQLRRQALWFAGAQSAATTPDLYTDGATVIGQQFTGMNDAFRSFTVELWARPEWATSTNEQILIERTFDYGQSDASQPAGAPRMRRNFLIGIAPDGRLFGGFDNPGGHDPHTDSVRLYGQFIQSNKWVHITIRMDGRTQEFALFVNGQQQGRMATALIPATGIDPALATNPDEPPVIRNGSLTLGAANLAFSSLALGYGSLANFPPMFPYMTWDATWANNYANFYRGWIDEVRVWDGPRSDTEIADTFKKRLTRADLDDNRARLVIELGQGRGRTALHLASDLYLSPILLNYYTFNNLFSAHEEQYVAQVPRGFNAPEVNVNRPDSDGDLIGDVGGAAVGWWREFLLRNTVYTNYHYLPWIENVPAHLPRINSIINTSNLFEVTYGLVLDSVYWSGTSAGGVAQTNSFPMSNNPYTFTYGSQIPVDLLPLGQTWAKQCTDFWDDLGATASWLENSDTTFDGLPSSWIRRNYGSYDPANNYTNFWTQMYTGANALYVALGLTNGQAYQYDLALGWLPSATAYNDYNAAYTSVADTDMDGMPDWWEHIFGLDAVNPLGEHGADGDPDNDGLSNIYEYWSLTDPSRAFSYNDGILDSDRDFDGDLLLNGEEMIFKTLPQLTDTDDDGFEDSREVMFGWDPTLSTSPGQRRVLSLDGTANSYIEVPDFPYGAYTNRLALESFILSADLFPLVAPTNDADLIRREITPGVVNYMFTLNSDMTVTAAFTPKDYSTTIVLTTDFVVPLNKWTSVQTVLDPLNDTLKIYFNGKEVAAVSTTYIARSKAFYGEARTIVGRNFAGYMDNVSISDTTRSCLVYNFDDGSSFNSTTPTPAFGSVVTQYEQAGQVEDTAAAVSAVAADWKGPVWLNRFSAAGTLAGNATMIYFNAEGITEDQLDSDEDGLSDAWEIANGFDPYNPDSNGNTIADGDEDTDGDGLSNYYEYLAGLNPRKASTDGVTLDIERDDDGDGLMNQLEQANGTMPNHADTDDDGIGDYEEIYGTNVAGTQAVGLSDPLNSLSPFIPRGLVLDGNGAVIVTNQARHALIEWTLGAWVNPSALANGTVLARSFSNGLANYELGIEVDGTILRPFARYSAVGVNGVAYNVKVSHENLAPGSIPVYGASNEVIRLIQNDWTHLAAVYAPADHMLRLYINGDCVAYRTDAIPLPIATDERFTDQPQLVIGARRVTGPGTYVNGFIGALDDVRFASYAVDYRGIRNMMGEQLIIDTRGVVDTNIVAVAQMPSTLTKPATEAVPNEFLVGMRQGINPATLIQKFKTDYKVDTVRQLKLANALYVRIPQGVDATLAKQKIKADTNVKYIEPNYIVHATQQKTPNDPRFPELWGMDNTGQLNGTADADIDAPEAWAVATGSDSMIVAVIDTGVDYNHPDLAANMWVNPDEIPANGIDDDGNGIIDDVYGMKAENGVVTGDPMDDIDHGTHCSGTIGAIGDNSVGVAGVNWKVKIMALKFLGPFGGTTADGITCIEYALEKKVMVSNNSWGGGGYSQALYDTLAKARDQGHLFIAAAGNSSDDNDKIPHYPSSYDLDNIVAVAATDNNDEMAYFSCYGATSVDIAAPGQDILSTLPVSMGSYGTMSGTSMATPHVTGAAALILSVNSSLNYLAVISALYNNADSLASLDGKILTGARLNIGNIIPAMQGGAGGLRVRTLSGWFRFDDGGTTIEDFTINANWRKNWQFAGRKLGSAAVTNSVAYLSYGDTDLDGLPDWWEETVGLDPLKAMSDDLVLDGERDDDRDGLLNFSEYRASLARLARSERGLSPTLSDTNSDGVTDANEDTDNDGLSNISEQNIHLTDPGNADTDDDGFLDGAELASRTLPTDAVSPKQNIALTFSGGAVSNTVVIADKVNGEYTLRHSAEQWTVEAWIYPTAYVAGRQVLLSRKVTELGLYNYELGLSNGFPYVSFDVLGGSRVECHGGVQVPLNTWTHLTGRFALGEPLDMNHLTLFANGIAVGETRTGLRCATGAGDLVLGSSGFAGQMLNARVWRIAQSDLAVFEMMRSELLGGNVGNRSGYLQVEADGFVKESATTLKPNGQTVDMLQEDWTLECWVRVQNPGVAGRLIARRNLSDQTDDDFNYALGLTPAGTIQGRYNLEYGFWTDPGQPFFVWVAGTDPTINNITGEIPVDDGDWHHVAYVRDANFCYIYVDGMLDTKQSRVRIPPIPNIIDDPMNYARVRAQGGPLILGEGAGDAWMTSLDEIRIWNRALPVVELKKVAEKNLAGIEPGLVSYFNFDFQMGKTADERAGIRDPDLEYGIYIRNARCITDLQDGPPITFDPLLSIQGVALVGMFNAIDGGLTLEDRIYRQGFKPFTQAAYAGRLGAGVSFTNRSAGFWVIEGLDSDGDGLPDEWESSNGLDPYSKDTDSDDIDDPLDDDDGDGLSYLAEYQAGTDPWDQDSDDDGFLDAMEDSDNDGLSNADEAAIGTNLGLADTDDDGMLDMDEGFDAQSRSVWAQNSLLPMLNRYLSLTGTAYLQVPAGRHFAEPTPMMRWTSDGKSFTIILDVNPSRYPLAGETNWLATCDLGHGVYNYTLQLLADGRVEAKTTLDPITLTNLTLTSTVSLPTNAWSTVTFMVEAESLRANLLINGEVAGFSTLPVLKSLITAQNSLSLVDVRFGEGFEGKMDNIAFYREILTAQTLKTLRDTENNRLGLLGYETENLYGCYTFDDGTSAVDNSGDIIQNNVSLKAGWRSGQVQDFACTFWPANKQRLANFTLQDWNMGWRNAGTIVGTGAKILPYSGEDINTKDSNGDGMPDAWSKRNGIDPYGPNASLGDMDNDGLSNYAEYLISTRYALAGVNPRSAQSLNQLPDYFNKPSGSKLTYGFMFSDHDFIEDWWEGNYMPSVASPFIYDPLQDSDADGWSNWAEARYSQAVMSTRPDIKERVIIGGRTITEIPVPLIETYVSYKGVQAAGSVVIQAYANPDMNGTPDAKWILAIGGDVEAQTLPLGFYEDKVVKTYLTPGSVVPGTFIIQFTDTLSGLSITNGYDRDGILYANALTAGAKDTPIGTINYVSGEIVVNMGFYQGEQLIVTAAQAGAVTNAATYVDVDASYIDVFYSTKLLGGWPQKLYLGRPTEGMIKGGTNYFFAFLDVGGTADSWDAGEPAGISTPFATVIGWDKNLLSLQLTDYTPYNLRLSLSTGLRSEDVVLAGGGAQGGGAVAAGTGYRRVRIQRSSIVTSGFTQHTIFDKVIYGRDYIHEGDIMNLPRFGGYGLDWGLIEVDYPLNAWKAVYKVYVGDADVLTQNTLIATFTNQFDTVRTVAAPVAPAHGAYVYSIRPSFSWSVVSSNNGYNAFAFELRSGGQAGTLVSPITARQVPTKDASTGYYVWEAPFYMGDKMVNGSPTVNNGVYYWRVQMLNSKYSTWSSTEWSPWRIFRWDVNTPLPPVGTATNLNGSSAGYGQLRAVVKYFGAVTNTVANRVILQAFQNRSFTGQPAAQYAFSASQNTMLTNLSLSATNAIPMRGLKPGVYYVRAFIDSNTNSVLDSWESWGYANYLGEQKSYYDVRPVTVSYSSITPLATVYIEDADTDQDWFPDAYEYEEYRAFSNFLEQTGPDQTSTNRGDGELNFSLLNPGSFPEVMMAMSAGSSEQQEAIIKLVSTEGQVVTPAVKPSVIIENLSFGKSGPSLAFDLTPAQPAKYTSALFTALMDTISAQAAQTTYRYNVRFSETLNAPRPWTTIAESGTVSVVNGETIKSPDYKNPVAGANGFFYVEIE